MKNKLMLTTALVGGLVASSSVLAQTTISGGLALQYSGVSASADSTNKNSHRGMGREAQLNVQNKGKTNIAGVDYAAGFALEFDGNSSGTGTETSTISNENTFIDLIIGKTTLTMGVDHIQNSHNNVAPTATENMADQLDAQLGVAYTNAVGANPKESMGVGIVQGTPFGSFSYYYVPNNGDTGSRDSRLLKDKAVAATSTAAAQSRESAYEVGFRGDLGVKGLTVKAFKNAEKDSNNLTTSAVQQIQGTSFGIGYALPNGIRVGADQQKTQKVATALAEFKTTQYGIAYAATKDLSLSINRSKTDDSSTTSTADEKWMQYAVGYNLGPIAAGVSYVKISDIGALTTGGDGELMKIMLSTAF
jgi:hypothetical protein